MSVEEIRDALTKVVAGHLRTIVAGLSVVELYADQAKVSEDLESETAAELQSLGYSFLSFVFESITDDNGSRDALGVPEIERARCDARIAKADNDRDATLQEEQTRLEKGQRRADGRQQADGGPHAGAGHDGPRRREPVGGRSAPPPPRPHRPGVRPSGCRPR